MPCKMPVAYKDNYKTTKNESCEDIETFRKQMEKDIKCTERFSEDTLTSPNFVYYRPKST